MVDVGPLTIEEVKTAKGTLAYKFYAREDKRPTVTTLRQIKIAIEKELIRKGILADTWANRRESYNASRRAKWAKNRDEINRKRRERAAQNRALNQAMQKLPDRI